MTVAAAAVTDDELVESKLLSAFIYANHEKHKNQYLSGIYKKG